MNRLLVIGGVIAVTSCAPLPPLPEDPWDRCRAMGGVGFGGPPYIDAEGISHPARLTHCSRTHLSEADVRRARLAWHERHKSDH